MFDWLHRIFQRSDGDERQRFLEDIDALNAQAGGGEPIVSERFLGNLKVRSGTLTMGDPQYVPDVDIPGVVSSEAAVFASLRQYPSGAATVVALTLRLGETPTSGARRIVGKLGIDSARLVVADKADLEQHWTEVGKDRFGMILTSRNDVLLRNLTRRFNLKTFRASPVRAQIVGPVSEQLERQIEDYLKADPEYAHFPAMYFHVQTNNSFDRALFMPKEWGFIPVGNAEAPLMFVCGTGRGDGVYEVQCEFADEIPRVVHITFIED